ncbi:MAG TPA: hypothetical protein VGX78_19705 [Pirellulales bacterium]|jgi:hypothetical protein|nr:hypothetical protein [Pirellulales bacterium]
MPDVAWRLDAQFAALHCGPLSASADLGMPSQGLTRVHWHAQPLVGCQLLGVEVDSLAAQTAGTLADRYQRSGDLVATYEQTAARPFRVQVYWRAVLPHAEHALPTIDLQVSVQTSLLDCRAAITTASLLADCESCDVLGSKCDNQGPFARLFRPAGLEVSYAEMIHPSDFRGVESATLADRCQWCRTKLFGRALEKGIILRARVRGVFVPRPNDVARATAAFDDFSRQPPPLTT